MTKLSSKIYIAGHTGLVGSAILRKLKSKGFKNILLSKRSELDLTDQKKVLNFLKKHKPSFIFIAAAKVGGIYSNQKFPAEFIYENLIIQSNIINSAYLSGVKNLILLGSSCIYPKLSKQPIKEKYLLDGKLEKTNEAYALAKIAGIKMCESYNSQYKTNFKCLMPTNTFGPNDNYDILESHFLPALIKKVHEIKKSNKDTIKIWGNGKAKREVIYVDDIADACIFFMKKNFKGTIINIGTGKDFTIKQYTKKVIELLIPGKKIKIKFDNSKPNGTPRKLLDISYAKECGWYAKTNLNYAIVKTYNDFLKELNK